MEVRDKAHSMRRRTFTLIEMLVVVAIIGILAALLMPALKKALSSARDMQCLNNFKQIGVAENAYLGDNGAVTQTSRIHYLQLPEAVAAAGHSSYYYWQHFLMPYTTTGASRITSYTQSRSAGGYTIQMPAGIFACPAVSETDILNLSSFDSAVRSNCKTGISFNFNGCSVNSARILKPSKTFMLMDMLGGGGTDQPCSASQLYSWGGGFGVPMWYSIYGIPPRHGNGVCLNVGFFDAHAETMFFGELPNQSGNAAGKWGMQ